jgi:DNA-binding CsgD family transcriptional regulator
MRDVDRARQAVIALCGQALDRRSFYEQTTDALLRVVPFEGSCWHTMDPATDLITSHHTRHLPDPDHGFPMLCANEYLADDVGKFADLAHGPDQVAVLSRLTGGHPERSLRYREFLRPNGIEGELRAAFTDRAACWGSLILVRPPGLEFTEEEAGLISSLCRPIAQALRRTLLVDASQGAAGQGPSEQGAEIPGLVVVGSQGAVETITAPARHWLSLLGEPAASTDEGWLPPAVHSVVAAVQRAARAGDSPTARLAVRSLSGEWIELHGALAEGGSPAAVAVILHGATPDRIAPMTLAAAGLTPREQEVVAQVVQGLPTKIIATRLSLSVYTVQDHLRVVFEKLGVRSKQELVAQVFFRDHLPRIQSGSPLTADGTLPPL